MASPVTGLDLQVGLGYVDADVEQVPGVTVDAVTPLGTINAILPGATLTPVQTPKWNINGLIRYEFPVGAGFMAVQSNVDYRSQHFFTLVGAPVSTQKGYVLVNASVAYIAPSEDWTLRFFVNNITDEEYLVQTFDLSGNIDNGGLFGLAEQYYGKPRHWGVTASFNF